jgi:hypothetical protein
METKLFGLNKDGNVLLWVNKDVTKFVIPDTVTDIKEWAFSNCTSLTSITIPSSVTSIHTGTFNECTSLTSITFEGSITDIGYNAFYRCTSLESITINGASTSISNYALCDCGTLKSITIRGVEYKTFVVDGCTMCVYDKTYNSVRWMNGIKDGEPVLSDEMVMVYKGPQFLYTNNKNTPRPETLSITDDVEVALKKILPLMTKIKKHDIPMLLCTMDVETIQRLNEL